MHGKTYSAWNMSAQFLSIKTKISITKKTRNIFAQQLNRQNAYLYIAIAIAWNKHAWENNCRRKYI